MIDHCTMITYIASSTIRTFCGSTHHLTQDVKPLSLESPKSQLTSALYNVRARCSKCDAPCSGSTAAAVMDIGGINTFLAGMQNKTKL